MSDQKRMLSINGQCDEGERTVINQIALSALFSEVHQRSAKGHAPQSQSPGDMGYIGDVNVNIEVVRHI